MSSDSASAAAGSLQLEAYCFYNALTRTAEVAFANRPETEPNLGGNFLYAGELDTSGRARVIAGSVAGCATLAATADLAAQKQAIRDGAVDFVVTSLDEALRILKNEIRKRATVAVGVGSTPAKVEQEMLERGVLPDFVFERWPGEQREFSNFDFGPHEIHAAELDRSRALLAWQVEKAPARWMAMLDAIALDCLVSDSWMHRWLRLSPRYCGRSVQAQRLLWCDPDSASQIVQRFGTAVQDGAIETQVSVNLIIGGETKEYRLSPLGTT